ncbi:MAG TPA: ATP-binding cassette domain-containing protein, partial [Thermomicrobiales bacterium]|nr:ATP-binding cassette domain-containing protein [Thermomicrobiales bacterium]
VLLGPSGCGKSTLLKIIAGLEDASEGDIYINGRLANYLRPKERDVAMVFQNYALYPHMTVETNIGFPLAMRRKPKAEVAQRVKGVAELVGLSDHLKKYPDQLSGGQRQRVALGRAIIREPVAFLMDEPLSNLDALLRVQMRSELLKLHRRVGRTTIYVTHDQIEAMTMANRIVVMREGVVQQVGTTDEVYQHPANTFVAMFVGSPPMNLLEGRLTAEGGAYRFDGPVAISLPGLGAVDAAGGDITLGIRPENVTLADPDAPCAIPGRVELIEAVGSDSFLSVAVAEEATIIVRVPAASGVKEGDRVGLHLPPDHLRLFDASGDRIAFSGERA